MPETWPRIEREIKAWIGGRWTLGPDTVYTETAGQVPDEYAVIHATPGPSDLITDAEIDIEITVYARTRARVLDLAREVEPIISSLAASGHDGFYVDDIERRFGFAIEPSPDATARQASAIYMLTIRPQ